jgi:hypothetical protein
MKSIRLYGIYWHKKVFWWTLGNGEGLCILCYVMDYFLFLKLKWIIWTIQKWFSYDNLVGDQILYYLKLFLLFFNI